MQILIAEFVQIRKSPNMNQEYDRTSDLIMLLKKD